MITCVPLVKSSIYQIRFQDKLDTICVYLYESMISPRINTLEINFNIALELSLCHFNETIEKISNRKEILIIQLSNNCSFLQQLTILKNMSWIENYSGIIFSGE